MVSPTERMSSAAQHVAPDWSEDRERAVRARLGRAIARRKRRQVVATATGALVFIVAALVFWSRGIGPNKGSAAVAAARSAVVQPLLHFEDGSTVTAASRDARAEPILVGPELVSTRLTAGAARFSVTPNPKRLFRVMARDVTVTVLGTIFTVAIEPNDVRVRVERGRVRVAWPAGEHEITVGEEVVVPSSAEVPALVVPAQSDVRVATHEMTADGAAAPSPADKAAVEAPLAPSAHHGAEHAAPHLTASWRALAEDGDYASAFAQMKSEGPSAVEDEPGDLLLAADVARLGGHPETAVAPLTKVVSAHASDSRAPLAAFTLGRTLLDQLGRPREAAQAFATARRLDPHGALTQDALAREVESWARAGEATLANERATEYVERYPKGRRLVAVKRLGGIE